MTTLGPIPVLMYHVVGEIRADDEADPHYAVPFERFLIHLDRIRASGRRPCSLSGLLSRGSPAGLDFAPVGMTFDDGHVSHRLAAEALLSQGGSADFFVNPGLVGRGHRLSWPALRDLASAGLSIQSHGMTHAHLDSLNRDEVENSLRRSRAAIEEAIGQPCRVFAPPGGRCHPALFEMALQQGYLGVCTSTPGYWRPVTRPLVRIPRLAVRAGTPVETLEAWVNGQTAAVALAQLRASVLWLGKRGLGRARYERWRSLALGRRP